MTFHTVFNVADTINKDKKYDRHDNVDRCSYVDSTRLIERFILEGNNLNAVRAKALNSGLYQDYNEIVNNNDDFIVPVYPADPTILQPEIEKAQNALKSRLASKHNDDLNDDVLSKSDLTGRSPDSSESKA